MTQLLTVHPTHPQPRLIRVAATVLRGGGVIAYPTDSSYALGCRIGDASAARRIRALRGVDERHHLTLVCKDLAQIGRFARMDNWQFRTVRRVRLAAYVPAPRDRRGKPRRSPASEGTIGVRVPDNRTVQALLAELDEPILSSTLILPGDEQALNNAADIEAVWRIDRRDRRRRTVSCIADDRHRPGRLAARHRAPRAWRSGAPGPCR
jgi:tRNA threonylcarbamoyl adenosine modification protein (Sua5/YciO/YrdC/YwlC family)